MLTQQPMSIAVSAPAKINLYLAVTGVRQDGFHSLVSLVAPVTFGDTLSVEMNPHSPADTLECNHPEVPVDGDNLILKAVAAYRKHWTASYGLHFNLVKRIPMGAGLGGGSSDAVATLNCLQKISGNALSNTMLYSIAESLGSDCPLFLHNEPQLMRGRGEILERLAPSILKRINNYKILLFKPSASISTPWAYGRLKAANGKLYTSPEQAEQEVAFCLNALENGAELPLRNDFEKVAFEKFGVFKPLFHELELLGYHPRMSGSGSACFILAKKQQDCTSARKCIETALGIEGFLGESNFA